MINQIKIVTGFLVLSTVRSEVPDSLIINIAQGPVRGYLEDNLHIFYNIPYATAPKGVDKFKAPLDPPFWTETFNAINNNIICPQMQSIILDQPFNEDCLVANVFVPNTNATNLPVVVMVHGGAYMAGNGNTMTPKELVKSGRIIAVTFNYRLGVHGFLCLGTDKAPGNAGMKDQIALLHWIKKNIHSFGGNPDDVTIAGHSAGASAVDLLLLSDMAKGLFNKVIAESGANVGVWSMQLDPLQIAKDYASYQGFDNIEDITALEDFYTSASWEDLIDIIQSALNTDSSFAFVPCVERNIGQELFLSDAPSTIMQEGRFEKYPMLYGFSELEGEFRAGLFDDWKIAMNEKFTDFLPSDLHFETTDERELVAQEVKEFYFGNLNVTDETVRAYIDYFSDVGFAYGMLRSVQLQVKAGNDKIFLYEYRFDGEEFNPIIARLNIRGAGHSYQTYIILDFLNAILPILSNRTTEMANIMRDLWLNFIINGVPTHDGLTNAWLPVSGALRSPHMALDLPPAARGPLLQRRAEFWDSIYEKYYRAPRAPGAAPSLRFQLILIAFGVLTAIVK